MPSLSHPLQFLLVIDYLQEENGVLHEHLGARRLRFSDDQRRRLAAKARTLGRRLLLSVFSTTCRSVDWRMYR